jgi:hypothetical protein
MGKDFLHTFSALTFFAYLLPVQFNLVKYRYPVKSNEKTAAMVNFAQDTGVAKSARDSAIEEQIFRKLDALPEVKKKNKYLFSLPNNSKGVAMWVVQRPTPSNNYYVIAVGHDAGWHYETFYNFLVWTNPLIIKYSDPMTGKAISLDQWRRQRSN